MAPDDAPLAEDEAAARRGLRARLVGRRCWHERNRKERGIVVVWVALMLVALIGMCGFAVDLSNWWLQSERIQRGADAGAHAGVVFLPGDLPSASNIARAETAKNGYRSTGSNQNATVAVTQEPNPNRLRVRVTTEVPTYFVRVFGINSVELTREAVAEYVAPVPMGSPQNKLGNDPEGVDPGTQLWVNLAGPRTAKEQGDRYSNVTCSGGEFGCTGTTNNEFDRDGYFFGMDVQSVSAGPLRFQVFDAPWVNTGATCSEQYTMPNASQITNLALKFPDAPTRYGSTRSGLSGAALAAAQEYCTGDSLPGTSGTAPTTTFIFRGPDDTPWSNTDNPLLPDCPPVVVPGYNSLWESNNTNRQNYLYNLLMHPVQGSIDPSDGVLTFAEMFRRFATFCEIPQARVELGTYVIQVKTSARPSDPFGSDPTLTTRGHNKMSFRAGFGTDGLAAVDGSDVTIAALGRLPIFANAEGADTRFYLARVLPYDAGRTLRINLFDMGEASQAGSLQILPPQEFAATFSGCSISRDNGGSLSVNSSTCTLSNVSSSAFNGRLLTLDVPIPTNYTCDQNSPTGCWIKVRASYNNGVTVNDATTWSAAILGNPIRLVE